MTRLKSYVTNVVDREVDPGLPFIALEHVESGTGRLLPGVELVGKDADDSVAHRAGDVRFGKLRPYLAKSLLMSEPGLGSGELLVFRPDPAAMDSRFLWYLTLSKPFLEWANATSYGVKMPRTSWAALGSFEIELPRLDEQRRIIEVLDAETARIDELISEQDRLCDLLAERVSNTRHQLILGADGTGEPGWIYARLKRFVRIARGRFTHRPRNDPALYDGAYPFIQTGDIANAQGGVIASYSQTLNERGLAASRLAAAGTLVMAIAANIGDVARLGFDACFPDSVVALAAEQGMDKDYLLELIRALKNELVGSSTLNTQLNINVDRIGEIMVPVPPEPRQRAIVDQLQKIHRHSSAVREEIANQIILLREHRRGLITAGVTGDLQAVGGAD